MSARIANVWENLVSALWFLPAIFVTLAFALSIALPTVDRIWIGDSFGEVSRFLGASPEAARQLLATLAGSMATIISVAFSVTVVAFQQAASQYAPRVLNTLTHDRGNQVVLGAYVATITYTVLILRQIRAPNEGDEGFVPAVSVTFAILLAIVSLGLFIFFMQHITQLLNVSILTSITADVRREIRDLFPSEFGEGSEDPPALEWLLNHMKPERKRVKTVIHAPSSGYLRRIDELALVKAGGDGMALVQVSSEIGDYVLKGATLVNVWARGPLSEDRRKRLESAFVLDNTRSTTQDPLFGVRQIVDIGVKALSPGVNDPTTAEQCLDKLGDLVAELARREFPSSLRETGDGTRYLFKRPDFAAYVDACFSQIRRAARQQVHTTLRLLLVIQSVGEQVPNEQRAIPLRTQVIEVLAALPMTNFTAEDQRAVRRRAEETLETLRNPPMAQQRSNGARVEL